MLQQALHNKDRPKNLKGKKTDWKETKKAGKTTEKIHKACTPGTQLINERMGKKRDRSLLGRGGSNLEWPSMAWV